MQMHTCRLCRGGYLLNPSTGRVSACTACGGVGEVDPKAICACGRPAVVRKDGFAICGRDECLNNFKTEAANVKSFGTYTPARGFVPLHATVQNPSLTDIFHGQYRHDSDDDVE